MPPVRMRCGGLRVTLSLALVSPMTCCNLTVFTLHVLLLCSPRIAVQYWEDERSQERAIRSCLRATTLWLIRDTLRTVSSRPYCPMGQQIAEHQQQTVVTLGVPDPCKALGFGCRMCFSQSKRDFRKSNCFQIGSRSVRRICSTRSPCSACSVAIFTNTRSMLSRP